MKHRSLLCPLSDLRVPVACPTRLAPARLLEWPDAAIDVPDHTGELLSEDFCGWFAASEGEKGGVGAGAFEDDGSGKRKTSSLSSSSTSVGFGEIGFVEDFFSDEAAPPAISPILYIEC